ncbi:MAG: aminotransferase class I/II-fold pyridoxal phosphate-dependent enzyme [Vicinamibacterales bacterium]
MILRSTRLPRDLTPNRLTAAVAARRAAGRPLADLTESNPTRVGLPYPHDLLAPLGDPRGLGYAPEPFGLRSAREAVAADYARRGVAVSPARIALTASTSDAYAHLFKLLCDPGDRVLVPQPSYPLFEHLTALEAVAAVPYPLDPHAGWRIDVEAVAAALDARSRAVLVVSPNNPTGSRLDRRDLDALAALAAARGVALIGDEVFADYPLDDAGAGVSVLQQSEALAFGLGGLSKSVGLPQVKVAWIGASGPDAAVDEALRGLEIVADTFLSVSTPAQLALADLLAAGAPVRRAIQDRLADNLATLRRVVGATSALTLHEPRGGWSAVVQVPATRSEETLAVELVERDGVLVHPGYFFDFPREAFVVVSLLPEPDVFAAGVAGVAARAAVAA